MDYDMFSTSQIHSTGTRAEAEEIEEMCDARTPGLVCDLCDSLGG